MINIAIIDQNDTYRKSLVTILEQVVGFNVVLDSKDCNCLRNIDTVPVQVVLIDISLGLDKCMEMISEATGKYEYLKIIILVMYRDELDIDFGMAVTMLKSSGKKDFEKRIRELVGS